MLRWSKARTVPARDDSQRGVIVASEPGVLVGREMADTDVFELVLNQFGI